jgi:hypothetical protein
MGTPRIQLEGQAGRAVRPRPLVVRRDDGKTNAQGFLSCVFACEPTDSAGLRVGALGHVCEKMKLQASVLVAAVLVRTSEAGTGEKCTFPTRGDASSPACVWDDYTDTWDPAFVAKRCCLEDGADNNQCDPLTNMLLTQDQCDEIIDHNTACATATEFYAVGFTSTNWACDDYAPDCLETLACDTANGFTGTPWIMCNTDGDVFRMHGCVRGPADPSADNEVYLPYKYMGIDKTPTSSKYSLSAATTSCDATNCGAIVAGNGACNQLGECSELGEYFLHQDAE